MWEQEGKWEQERKGKRRGSMRRSRKKNWRAKKKGHEGGHSERKREGKREERKRRKERNLFRVTLREVDDVSSGRGEVGEGASTGLPELCIYALLLSGCGPSYSCMCLHQQSTIKS